MTLAEVKEEIILVKKQIANTGGVSGKSIDGASVTYATAELYKRLNYLEEMERKMSMRRTVQTLDISGAFDAAERTLPNMQRPMTPSEVDELVRGVFEK